MLFLVGCESDRQAQPIDSSQSEETVTDITIKDLNGVNGNSYIDGVESQYAVVGYQGSFTKSMSYDSDVIKNIEVENEDVNTMIEGDYPLSFKITVDVNAFCEKERKQNGITGDTITITYDSKIFIIDKEEAEGMIEYSADPEHILGYR